MKTVLVLGAGRSSPSLIQYLLEKSRENDWTIVVADASEKAAKAMIGEAATGRAVRIDLNEDGAFNLINECELVISMLPPVFHPRIASSCLEKGKHLLTASYISPEMKACDQEAKAKGLLFLNECGLDPGIDHMSSMQVIATIQDRGGEILSFESFAGGLIAPDTDPENPWRYKFTWNPRNVVMAGQGTAKYLQHGELKYIPYQQLFARITPVHVPGYGIFEGYANRDSLVYREAYRLLDIRTMLRGTLRYSGFCAAWNVLVQLGCCDDSYLMEGVAEMTHRDFFNSFLAWSDKPVEEKLVIYLKLTKEGTVFRCLKWSGFFDDEPVGLTKGTPAQITEHILSKRWRLDKGDKDMVVMWHRFIYSLGEKKEEIQTSLVVTGEDDRHTAMARTVGLPLGMAAKLLLENKIPQRGVVIPTVKEIYEPVLKELKEYGIQFRENTEAMKLS